MKMLKSISILLIVLTPLMALTPSHTEATTKTDKRECAKTDKGCPKPKSKAKTTKGELKFRSCKAAKAAGYSNMRRGQPGYSANLDRDNDGIACDK
jgi:hypothetical protein